MTSTLIDSVSPHTVIQDHRSVKLKVTAKPPTMSGRFLYFDMENGDRLAVLQSLVSGNTITAAPSTIFEVSGAEGTKTKTAEQLAEKYSSVELVDEGKMCGQRFLDTGVA